MVPDDGAVEELATQEEVARCLGAPGTGGVGCDRAVEDLAGGDVDDEATHLHRGAGPPGRPAGLGPVAGDSASMPTQQGLWCNEPAGSLRSGQGRRDGAEQGPILVGERWSVVLSAQDCELVAKHDDLKVLRASRARQRHEQPVQNATHRTPGCKRIMPGQRARPYFWHPQAGISWTACSIPPSRHDPVTHVITTFLELSVFAGQRQFDCGSPVPGVGFEPTRPCWAEGFKPSASAIPPPGPALTLLGRPSRKPTQAACGTSPGSGNSNSGLPAAAVAASSMSSVARQSSLRTRAASCGGSSLARTTPSIMSASTAGQARPRLRTDTSTEPPGPRRIVRSSPATRGGVRNAGTCSSITVAAAARRRPASANLQTCFSLMTTL